MMVYIMYIIIAILISILGLFALIFISNNFLKIKKYTISNSKLPKEFNNFKIVHISDVHSKIFGKNNIEFINKVKEINPDIVIMSGDIIDKREQDIETFLSMYKDIYDSYTTFYSIGNHERKLGYKKYKRYIELLKESGVNVIVNGKERLYKNKEYIVINALKFRENMQPKILTAQREEKFINYMNKKLAPVDINKFNILITHDPENFKMYQKLNIDLIFSGHIHGGLIRFGKICLLSPRRNLFPKNSYGLNKKDNTCMITSAGIGSASIPIRLFNRPEIVTVTLKKCN